MTEEKDDVISSLYPPPPPYFKFFTKDNIDSYQKWKMEQENDMEEDDDNGKVDKNRVPEGELKFLVPPEQPDRPYYSGFGNIWSFDDKLPSLKDSGWTQLYGDDELLEASKAKIQELHKLVKSLLLNFLELVGVMSIEPSKFHYKIEDIKLILININHLLNSYRPHQSRESLIMLLRKQIDSKKNDIKEIDRVTNEVRTKVLDLVGEIDTTLVAEQKPEEESSISESLRIMVTEKILNKTM